MTSIKNLQREIQDRKDAENALEAANKELEAFSYSVSHDLRAPLRHMSGFLELLRHHSEASLNEKSSRYLNLVTEATGKMGCLIDDLLSFSRTGRTEMQKSIVDLERLVREAVGELAQETEGRKIEWKVGSLPEIHADRALVRIALDNLLSNAVKYTRPRDLARIEVGATSNDEGDIEVFVRDNGVGFDMAYVDKLFGVFQRLHRTEDFDGTGIGLAIVNRIVQRHGGRTWASGKVDEGATFCFSLPALKEEES